MYDGGVVEYIECIVDGWLFFVFFFLEDCCLDWQGMFVIIVDGEVVIFVVCFIDCIGVCNEDNIDLFVVYW